MSKGNTAEEINEMILGRLKVGPATTERIQSSLIPIVDRGWLLRRLSQLQAEKRVSQTGGMWYLSKTEEIASQSIVEVPATPATPVEPVGLAEPIAFVEEEKAQVAPNATEKSSTALKELIVLELKESGPLTVDGLVRRLRSRTPSAKLYNSKMYDALYRLERGRVLVKERRGRALQWRIPTEEESRVSLLEAHQEVKTQPPAQEEKIQLPIPQIAEIPGRLEVTRKYHIPLEEVKKRFPEILGVVLNISIVAATPPEYEMLVETEEKL